MWLIVARQPLPDVPYWPGRRLLAAVDALAWPLLWAVAASRLPGSIGVLGPVVVALALVSALGRLRRALLVNQRYRFTTWRWGRWTAALLLVGLAIKLATVQP